MRALGPTASVTTSAGLLGAAAAAATAFALVEVGPTAGIALGVLPAAILAGAALLSWGRTVLLACALALPLTGLTFLFKPIPIAGSNIYVQDLIVLLAVGAWAVASLAGRGREQAPPVPRTPVLGVAVRALRRRDRDRDAPRTLRLRRDAVRAAASARALRGHRRHPRRPDRQGRSTGCCSASSTRAPC